MLRATVLLALLLPYAIGFSVDNALKNSAGCSLSPELVAEIRGYQPVVDKIVTAAVSGSFTGNTYRR